MGRRPERMGRLTNRTGERELHPAHSLRRAIEARHPVEPRTHAESQAELLALVELVARFGPRPCRVALGVAAEGLPVICLIDALAHALHVAYTEGARQLDLFPVPPNAIAPVPRF